MGGRAFDPEKPLLGGIGLAMSENEVRQRLGEPSKQYDLPVGDSAVRMNEYDRLTVGFGLDGTVVYVEISSGGAETGIAGVEIGSGGREAAAALDVPYASDSLVLACEVSGGLLKIDLTPDTHRVLSVKLTGQF